MHIPDGVTSFGEYAFSRCYNLSEINIPSALSDVGDCAFNYCESIESISLPDSVRSLGYGAFGFCQNLTSINLNEGLTQIGSRAFSYTGIGNLSVPNSTTSIDPSFINNCHTLQTLSVPVSANYRNTLLVGENGNLAYNPIHLDAPALPNSQLNHIIFTAGTGESPDYDTDIIKLTPWYVNRYNDNLKIQFNAGIKSIGEYMFSSSLIDSLDLPSTIERIGDYAFYRNKHLKSVTMREGMTKIGYQAFGECENLTEAIMPSSLTTIRYNAFIGNDDLVMTVCKDSKAHEYAKKYGITYKLTGSDVIEVPDLPDAKDVGLLIVGKEMYGIGDELLVPIEMRTNPGIASLILDLNYDKEALELVGLISGDALSGGQWITGLEGAVSQDSIYWTNNLAMADEVGTGTLVTLKFRMKEGAEYGKEYQISVTCDYDNSGALDIQGHPVKFATTDGSLYVNDFVYGNISGDEDGDIDAMDVALLKWSLIKLVQLNEKQLQAADVNCDNRVNALDAMILERHVAKWDGYEKLPYC